MDKATEERAARQARLITSRATGQMPTAGLPPPPYHLGGVRLLYLMCRFDPADVRKIIPPELTPSPAGWGAIATYTVASGWGIAPYTGFFLGLELDGLDSSDTSPSQYMHSGLYSGVGGEVMRGIYNTNFRIGWSRLNITPDMITSETGTGAEPLVRCVVDRLPTGQPMTGTSRFIGRQPGAGYDSYSVAWETRLPVTDVKVRDIAFLPGAADVMHVIRPVEYVWTVFLDDMSMAFTPPRPLDAAMHWRDHDAQTVGLVGMFSRLGRAAAIVTREGRLLSLNRDAEMLLAAGGFAVAGGMLQPVRSSDRAPFAAMLASVASTPISERIALAGSDGSTLLAQGMALSADIAGTEKVLVVFDEPARAIDADPTPALQLLGLTPAEARIAGLVGAGQSPREAADALGLTLHTVRSALKIVFDKLGISRQAELAKIVARLAG